jgi:hypothetical protein
MGLRRRLSEWFRKPTASTEEQTLEPPLQPGEATFKDRPGPEPPLEPGEATYKEQPGPAPPLSGDEPRGG